MNITNVKKRFWRPAVKSMSAGVIICAFLLPAGSGSAQEETEMPEITVRLANGMPVEGNVVAADPEGLTVQSPKGARTLPWKYLSAGTRWRYELPMLAELEAKRIKAEKAAKAKAEAAAKAAAAKAAAAATNKPPAKTAAANQPAAAK
ncbi:MAG: hypothetical protein PHP98_01240 [Kiritimatiellae bacterium]|nr:hypothetical protein [Kiritimatiellia bacterium]